MTQLPARLACRQLRVRFNHLSAISPPSDRLRSFPRVEVSDSLFSSQSCVLLSVDRLCDRVMFSGDESFFPCPEADRHWNTSEENMWTTNDNCFILEHNNTRLFEALAACRDNIPWGASVSVLWKNFEMHYIKMPVFLFHTSKCDIVWTGKTDRKTWVEVHMTTAIKKDKAWIQVVHGVCCSFEHIQKKRIALVCVLL